MSDLHPALTELAERLRVSAILTGSIATAPWIDAYAELCARRLPQPFETFVRRYTFLPFEWASIGFFGNSGADRDDDLNVAPRRDARIWEITSQAGFLQFGRPAGGAYDPLCFDVRLAGNRRESPIVQLDHEAILTKQRIRITQHIAPSFVSLATTLLAEKVGPVAID